MSMSVLEPESMSDALFSCVYRWINGHPIDKKEASAAAARHRDKATTFGALAQKLKSLVLGAGATYESLCESGLILTSSEKQKKARAELVAKYLGENEVKELNSTSA